MDDRPVVFDDTVYFIPFEDEASAASALSALRSESATRFFQSRVFWDAKRPINKALLQSLALQKLLGESSGVTGRQLQL